MIRDKIAAAFKERTVLLNEVEIYGDIWKNNEFIPIFQELIFYDLSSEDDGAENIWRTTGNFTGKFYVPIFSNQKAYDPTFLLRSLAKQPLVISPDENIPVDDEDLKMKAMNVTASDVSSERSKIQTIIQFKIEYGYIVKRIAPLPELGSPIEIEIIKDGI